MIISLGYRIKSIIATNFRRWATERLKEYMIKGFTMDDERLKQLGGGNYWKELLDRIRDIHSSEKVMYRQVLIIILRVRSLLHFSKWCRTSCTLWLTDMYYNVEPCMDVVEFRERIKVAIENPDLPDRP